MSPEPMPLPYDVAHDDDAQSLSKQTETFTRPGWSSVAYPARSSVVGNARTGDRTACNGAVVGQTGTGIFLYVANFSDGTIDVFDGYRERVGSFTDPCLPGSYAPLDVQLAAGSPFVTSGHRDAVHGDGLSEPERGFIAEFDPDGILLDRAEFRPGRG